MADARGDPCRTVLASLHDETALAGLRIRKKAVTFEPPADMNSQEQTMEPVLVRFFTESLSSSGREPCAAVLIYGLEPREIARRLLAIRRRLLSDSQAAPTPRRFLASDGPVLAAELLRSLGSLPAGTAGVADPRTANGQTLDVFTSTLSPALPSRFVWNGLPVRDDLSPDLQLQPG